MDSQSPTLKNETKQLPPALRKAKKPQKLLRQKSIHIRVTECEWETIRNNAYTAGIPPALYCHNVVVGDVVKARLTPEQMKDVRTITGVSNNLNQLVKNLHRSNFHFSKETLEELVQIVNTINHLENGFR